jgi:hypothetical protein
VREANLEITFQNSKDDLNARFDFLLTETSEGKRIGKRAFTFQQFWTIIVVTWFGAIIWGLTGNFTFSAIITLGLLASAEFFIFLFSSFKPNYHYGKKAFINELKNWTDDDWERFLLPKTIIVGSDWLEESCAFCLHRWKWSVVDQINVNASYIFLFIGNCNVVCIPKSAFSSEESFQEFGKELMVTFQTEKKNH